MNTTAWENLADYLKEQSKEICALNECTEDNHRCECYAYIREDGALLDTCGSDYFQGCSRPYAAVSLPWDEDGNALMVEVEDQCADFNNNEE